MAPIILIPLLSALLLLLSPTPSHSADPDALQDFCIADLKASPSLNGYPCKSNVSSSDFFYKGLMKEGNTSNAFRSWVTPANVRSFPGLNTLGISMNRVDLAPGGINSPHVHPRASEMGFVVKGKVLVGLVSTDNVYYSNTIGEGEIFVIPRGIVHFQLNVGKGKAKIITAFNSQFPGSVVVSRNLFGSNPLVQNEVLEKGFLVDKSVVHIIKTSIAKKI